ncbi:MAG: MATE family efflux transporter [Clostridium sp.]
MGASCPITIIYMAFAVGMNLGASVVISRLFGAGDKAGLRRAVSTAFISVLVLSVLLSGIWIFLQRSHDVLDPYTGRHYGRRCSVSEDLCVRSELSAVLQCVHRHIYRTW